MEVVRTDMADWQKWNLRHRKYGPLPWAVQAEAMRQANGRKKYGFWLEQGLGKTPLALNEWINSGVDTLVVVAPQSFKIDWTQAPAEWGLEGVHTGYWPKHPLPKPGQRSVYAINYEAIRSSGFEAISALMSRQSCFLVFDETSSISNFLSQTSNAAIRLAQYAKFVRGLNGTPITRNASDLWAQLRVLGALNGYNAYAFKTKYCKMGGFMGRQVVGIQYEDQLSEIVNKYAFRALKTDWRADLPLQIFHAPVMIEMTKHQKQLYNRMLEEFGIEVNGREISVSLILNRAAKLQQLASGIITDGSVTEVVVPYKQNPKIHAVRTIHDSGPNKTLVTYTYRESGSQLFAAATEWGLNPAWFKGGLTSEEQSKEKRRFNEDPECRMLIGQQSACCMGHTLLGGEGDDRCCRTIFYENSYSLRDRLQMQDRIHRGEADLPCSYFDLCAAPIDLIPISALRAKKQVADLVDEMVVALQQRV
jgi:hypothetical protein